MDQAGKTNMAKLLRTAVSDRAALPVRFMAQLDKGTHADVEDCLRSPRRATQPPANKVGGKAPGSM
eukprot:267347-Prorocentrum_lima.AAC.1